MLKATIFLQTLALALLPITLYWFNIPLSFTDKPSQVIAQASEEVESKPVMAFGSARLGKNTPSLPGASLEAKLKPIHKKLSKIIKESRIAKTDYRINTVVIDPGHGGHDPGCSGSNSREKHLALAIGLELRNALRLAYPELNVIMTRDKDVFIPLYKRAAIANRNNADLFISIHCNYIVGSRATRGSETYVMGLHTADHNLDVAKRENAAILLEDNYEKNYDYDPNSPEGHIMLSMFQNAYLEQSIFFAEKVEEKIATVAQRRSRGVKQAGFVVLKETAMPSVLIETGFLSNRGEERYLKTSSGQRAIASSILSAFHEYKSAIEGSPTPNTPGLKPVAGATTPTPRTTPLNDYPAKRQTVVNRNTPIHTKPTKPATSNNKVETATSNSQSGGNTPPQEMKVWSEPDIISLDPSTNLPSRNTTVRKQNRSNPSTNRSGYTQPILFHIQLAASPNPINTAHSKWQSLGYQIEVIKENSMYKYQARNFTNYYKAEEVKRKFQNRGFLDAFIVAYRGTERLSIEVAKKEIGLK